MIINKMGANEYINCLMYEINMFECTYNKYPEMIVMSSALVRYLGNDIYMYLWVSDSRSNGIVGNFAGIPLMVYGSNDLECHLVEKTIHMD